MLVLSRKHGECIRISHTISVTVLEIRGGRVKLGLSGPPDVLFQREELCQGSKANGPPLRRTERVLEAVGS